jgi:hypothetical protein
MRACFAWVLFAFALVAVPCASAQDAKGWFEEYCDGATFHLTKFAGQTEWQELRFWFRTPTPGLAFRFYPMGPSWFDVLLCPSEEHCDESAKAKMQFQERRKRVLSGRYVVDIKGEHKEGSFTVKERFHKHPVHICE